MNHYDLLKLHDEWSAFQTRYEREKPSYMSSAIQLTKKAFKDKGSTFINLSEASGVSTTQAFRVARGLVKTPSDAYLKVLDTVPHEVELRRIVEEWRKLEDEHKAKRKECFKGVGRLLMAIKAKYKFKWNDFAYMTGISASFWCDMARLNAKHSRDAIIKLLDALDKRNTNQ